MSNTALAFFPATMSANLSGGTFTDNIGLTFANMTLGGTYNGTANLTLTGNLSQTGQLYNNGNTAIGSQALANNTTAQANTAIGGNALVFNTGVANTAVGYDSLRANTTGLQNTAVGRVTLLTNTTGTQNTAIGYSADVSTGALTNATALGAGAIVNASNKVRLGNASVTVIEGQVAYTFSSDRNIKENFQPVDGKDVLRKIRGLNLTSWNYIGQDASQFRHYGPMAQDFFAAFGHDTVGTSGTPTTINSGDMAGIMMVAIKELATETAAMREENAAMKKRLAELEARDREREARFTRLEHSLAPASRIRATTAALEVGELSEK